MRRAFLISLALSSLLLLLPQPAIAVSPQCFITGGGSVADDSFGGEASSRRGDTDPMETITGRWTHITAAGDTFQGQVDSLICRRNGGDPRPPSVEFSVATWSGTGTWNGEESYTFIARAEDHGEPGTSDTYSIAIFQNDVLVYTVGGILDSGNFQIHATNPGHP